LEKSCVAGNSLYDTSFLKKQKCAFKQRIRPRILFPTYQNTLATPLIQVPRALVTAVELARLRKIEPPREFGAILPAAFDETVKMFIHQDEDMKIDGIGLNLNPKGLTKGFADLIVYYYRLSRVAPAYQIYEISRVVYSQRSHQGFFLTHRVLFLQ